MASAPRSETNAAAQRRLSNEMLTLGKTIEKQEPGSPHKLELLRQQASLSDDREQLRSGRR
jgi:hypothetical protein